ncbi:hemolysin XhlA family protein [Agrobacterium sp. rho-13.3]|uniref:hemolysin XhlA family protein n=1 Tax=Agrobacterium sp. rho-13.3 TaxID=3072980 RepID=UPI002A131BCA|nr:hemolysin XhlA family protein [Agrobacterium sp. rho-13.3]MDX8310035.1 hemolysin XhlA family protein [Agrobacterium sp. rho-13.3]
MTELNLQSVRTEKAHDRIDVVEKRVNDLELKSAVTDERMNSIQESLGKINSDTSWIVRLIIGGIILAVMTFLVKGGLNVQ